MKIKHPYFDGSLTSRIEAIGRSQGMEAKLFRSAPRELIRNNLDDFMEYVADKDELYSVASRKMLDEMNELVDEEYHQLPEPREDE